MRKPHLPIIAVGAILAMAPLHALAQQVTFIPVGGVSVPTLNTYGLILMLLIVAGAAYWLTRKHGAASRIMTLAALTTGTVLLAANMELVQKAWAGSPAEQVSATASPVVLANPTNGKRYQIQNDTGGAIVITALVDGGDGANCAAANSYYDVEPLESYQAGVPGCAPNVTVPVGMTCTVEVYCATGAGEV